MKHLLLIKQTPFLLLCILTIYESTSARLGPLSKPLTGLIFLSAIFLLVLYRPQLNMKLKYWSFSALYFSLTMLVPPIFLSTVEWNWVLASFLTFSALPVMLLAVSTLTDMQRNNLVWIYILCGVLAAIISVGFQQSYTGRFNPPTFFVLAFAVVLLLNKITILRVVFLAFLLAVAFESQVRVNFVLPIVLLMSVWVFRVALKSKLFLLVFLCVFPFFVIQTVQIFGDIGLLVPDSRLSKLLTWDGFYQEVMLRRSAEVIDAIGHFQQYGSWLNVLFGFGHGATYEAQIILRSLGSAASEMDWRFTDYNEAYVIHFGPMRYFFRFGLVGSLFAVVTVAAIIWMFIRNITLIGRDSNFIFRDTAILASICWCSKFFIAPAEKDMGFAFAIAIALLLGSTFKKQRELRSKSKGFESSTLRPARNRKLVGH